MKNYRILAFAVVILTVFAVALMLFQPTPPAVQKEMPPAVSAPTSTLQSTLSQKADVPAIATTPVLEMASHKALYTLVSGDIVPGSDIRQVKGAMFYSQEDTCDGWTTDRRFSTEYYYLGVSTPLPSRSRFLSFESKDGKRFSFSSERNENGEEQERIHGAATPDTQGKMFAVYAAPDDLRHELPTGFYLPTAHTAELVRHARAGDKFFNATLFEGADKDGPAEVNAFIGAALKPEEIAKIVEGSKDIDASLLPPEAWHLRLAVFPLEEQKESLPAYEIDMVLHANGIVSAAEVSYPEMRIKQVLATLQKLPGDSCH